MVFAGHRIAVASCRHGEENTPVNGCLEKMTGGDDFELERLRAELAQEQQMKEMLEQSLGELQLTVDELDKRIDSVGDESNEWKTRYETQVEMNQQLEKQIIVLSDKVEDSRRTLKDSKIPKTLRTFDDQQEATPHYVKSLNKEKMSLESQMRDLEWRLDQESKAYHKANEERKQYTTEINAARGTIDHIKHKGLRTSRESDSSRGYGGNTNIPQDQRIIDPKRGPIKKTAAVKTLPKLE